MVPQRPALASQASGHLAPSSPVKILLVDDTPANLTAVETLLEGLADTILLARSGQEALEIILREEFAVVLLDVKMPDIDGFEVATLVRKQKRFSSLPIIFISAFEPSRAQTEKAYELGAVDYVTKPIVGAILRSKVATFVELCRSRRELERRVSERTQELRLANEALTKSEERLALELAATQQLQGISTQLIREESTQALYEQILDAATFIMHSEYASIQMFYPERGPDGELRLLGFRGFNPEAAKFWEWVRPGSESTCGIALRTRERVVVSDVEKCAFMAGSDDLKTYLQTGIHAVQSTPLVSRTGKLLGMISTHWLCATLPSKRDLRLFDVLARQAADLIERSTAEDQIRRLNASLETLVGARTAALKNTIQELDAFAYTIAHDLRAPLRGIHGCSAILLEDHSETLNPEGRELAQRIAEAAKRMDLLITDLLEYCHLNRQQLPLAKVNLMSAVDGALEQSKPDLQSRGAKVEVEKPLFEAFAHEVTLKQVILNLLLNAIKFVAPGVEPRVRIWAERKGAFVRLWVEDNGIGIDPAHVGRLFKVFERLHPPQDYPGTGIGLAIVRRVMDRMGGRTGVESSVGKGSSFWIEIPTDAPAPQENPGEHLL